MNCFCNELCIVVLIHQLNLAPEKYKWSFLAPADIYSDAYQLILNKPNIVLIVFGMQKDTELNTDI